MKCERCKKYLPTSNAVKNPKGLGFVHMTGPCEEPVVGKTRMGVVVTILGRRPARGFNPPRLRP